MKINLFSSSDFSKQANLKSTFSNLYYTKKEEGVVLNSFPGVKYVSDDLFTAETAAGRLFFQAAFPLYDTNYDNKAIAILIGDRLITVDLTDYTILTSASPFTGASYTGVHTYIEGATNFLLLNGEDGYSSAGVVADPDFPVKPFFGTYLDGRYIVSDYATRNRWAISAIDDPTSWAALDRASANKFPDQITGIKSLNQYLIIFNSKSIEFWFNTRNPDFPFERAENLTINVGTMYPGSVAEIKELDSILFVGNSASASPKVYLMENNQAMPISDPSLEQDLADTEMAFTKESIVTYASIYAQSRSVHAYTISLPGTFIYVLNIPYKNKTYYYDVVNKYWGQLKTHTGDMWPFKAAVGMGGRIFLFGDGQGKLMELSHDVYQLLGDPLIREIELKDIELEYPGRHTYLTLNTETGKATTDHKVALETSNNYGRTYGSRVYRDLGPIGNYSDIVQWRQLGEAAHRRYRITYSGNNDFMIKEIYTDVRPHRRESKDMWERYGRKYSQE